MGLHHASAHHHVTVATYARWELGIEGANPPTAFPGLPTLSEVCFLLRRRAGINLADIASEIGANLTALAEMEAGNVPCTLLWEFWATR